MASYYGPELYHYGVKGMKWGVRHYNPKGKRGKYAGSSGSGPVIGSTKKRKGKWGLSQKIVNKWIKLNRNPLYGLGIAAGGAAVGAYMKKHGTLPVKDIRTLSGSLIALGALKTTLAFRQKAIHNAAVEERRKAREQRKQNA